MSTPVISSSWIPSQALLMIVAILALKMIKYALVVCCKSTETNTLIKVTKKSMYLLIMVKACWISHKRKFFQRYRLFWNVFWWFLWYDFIMQMLYCGKWQLAFSVLPTFEYGSSRTIYGFYQSLFLDASFCYRIFRVDTRSKRQNWLILVEDRRELAVCIHWLKVLRPTRSIPQSRSTLARKGHGWSM